MIVIPAIDLKDGQCVRLKQGRMEESTIFSDDPVEQAGQWLAQGARRLHIVDLNGAFEGSPVNADIVTSLPALTRNFRCRSAAASARSRLLRSTSMPG